MYFQLTYRSGSKMKQLTHTLKGSFGSEVSVILNVTLLALKKRKIETGLGDGQQLEKFHANKTCSNGCLLSAVLAANQHLRHYLSVPRNSSILCTKWDVKQL